MPRAAGAARMADAREWEGDGKKGGHGRPLGPQMDL